MNVKDSKVFTDEREVVGIEAREVRPRSKYIDADKALHKIRRHMAGVICRGDGYIPAGKDSDSAYEFLRGYEAGALYIANEMFKNEHIVDAVEVVRARWVKDGDWLVCLNCESEINVKNSLGIKNPKNYCPCCGAKMDLEV